MRSLSGCGFLNLKRKLFLDFVEPIALVRKNGFAPNVVRDLVANQIGVDNKKICGQEKSAQFVLAAQKILRQCDSRRCEHDAQRERDFLPKRISPHQENRDGQERNQGEENEALLL